MSPAEASALLTIASGFDNRRVDPDVARSWAVALDGVRFEDARDAVVAHYRASREWLMPAHILDTVKRVRAGRIAAQEADLIPPPELSPIETQAWMRTARQALGDGRSAAEINPAAELRPRPVSALLAGAKLPAPPTTDVANGVAGARANIAPMNNTGTTREALVRAAVREKRRQDRRAKFLAARASIVNPDNTPEGEAIA